MTNSVLKRAVVISFFGHMTLFGVFSLSFGPRIPEANFAPVCFWGAFLRSSDLADNHISNNGRASGVSIGKTEVAALNAESRKNLPSIVEYSKPHAYLVLSQERADFITNAAPFLPPAPLKKEPAIMFYPKLPYHFALYFKDRQTVHIELMFKVVTDGKGGSVLIKRKISSGNLEADLLSMRYISRYLFMQQSGFVPDKWQAVKIDLSTVND
jgi:hypothetical protein